MTETAVRHFSVDQAEATLPLVRRIVSDLLDLHPRWRVAVAAFEAEQAAVSSSGETPDARATRIEAGRLAGEIEACIEELEQIGCVFKGFESGLVDFPAVLDGRDVFLCWQYDEPHVAHWHDVAGGFAGRQPIGPSHFPGSES